MRIAVVTPWFPNVRHGWPARFVSDSAIALSNAGAQVSMSVVRAWIPPGLGRFAPLESLGDVDRDQFPEIRRLTVTRYLCAPGETLRSLSNVTLDRAIEATLDETVEVEGADVIHAHTESFAPAALHVALRHDLPLVVTLHGENTNQRFLKAPRQAERFQAALSRANRLVIVGEPLRSYAERLAGRADHIETIWNGVDPPLARRHVPRPDAEPIELICTANLQEGKGVELLLEAAARLHSGAREGIASWRLTIIGDGPLRDVLRRQTVESGLALKVEFVGKMSNADVLDRLLRADIFVLPSYREAFGIAYVEAMASGLLTIGVEGQGPSQFIEHGRTGLLVKPCDVGSIEAALRDALSDPDRRWREIADAGADFARSYCTWNAHADRMLDVFRDASS